MTRLPAGRSSTSIPGSSPSSLLGSVRRRRPSPPGKSVAGDLCEVALHRLEGLGEPALDRLGRARRELLELLEASLEVGALGRELRRALLLGLVLLLRERVHLAELLAAALEARDRRDELVAVVALGGLGRAAAETALGLVALRLVRASSTSTPNGFRRLGGRPQLHLRRTEAAQLGARARRCVARASLCAERRLEALARRSAPRRAARRAATAARRGSARAGRRRPARRASGARELVDLGGEPAAPGLAARAAAPPPSRRRTRARPAGIPADPSRSPPARTKRAAPRAGRPEARRAPAARGRRGRRASRARRPRALDELERARRVVRDDRGRRWPSAAATAARTRARPRAGKARAARPLRRARVPPAASLRAPRAPARAPPALTRAGASHRRAPSLGADGRVEHAARPSELGARAARQATPRPRGGARAARRGAQPVQRRGRLLAAAGGVGELLFGLVALGEQRLELRFRRGRRERCPRGRARPRRAARRAARSSSSRPRLQAGDLARDFSARSAAVAWSARGRSRFLHLVLEVARAFDLRPRRARASARRDGDAA